MTSETELAVLGEAFGLDFAQLLAPLPGDSPCGSDARAYDDAAPEANAAYRFLKGERAAARTLERSACFDDVAQGAAPAAQTHWQNILAQAPDFLAQHSKDLEVLAWVIEAMLRLHGLAGFSAAMHLAGQMVADFGGQLHPQPDEDGIETQVAPLAGLNGDGTEGTLIRPLRLLPLTQMNAQGQIFSYSDFQIATEINSISDAERREQREAEAPYTLANIRQAMATSEDAFCHATQQALTEALAALKMLSDALYEVFGVDSPPTSLIKNTLLDIQQVVSDLLRGRVLADPQEDTGEGVPPEEGAQGAMTSQCASTGGSSARGSSDRASSQGIASAVQNHVVAGGVIDSREAALTQLTQIAEYFRATEPHSPMAGVLDRAIRWGRMPIEQLILELLPEASARQIFSQLTGISAQESAEPRTVAPVVNAFEENSAQSPINSEGVW